ncbi:hypothetical protein niasHT_006735 [Heterodera trifolii]|uniref:Uncharacterized protein n=1 Tax=Heterodera trifolii TaxID=157864 RepID=A0ABD2LZH7_9BILA
MHIYKDPYAPPLAPKVPVDPPPWVPSWKEYKGRTEWWASLGYKDPDLKRGLTTGFYPFFEERDIRYVDPKVPDGTSMVGPQGKDSHYHQSKMVKWGIPGKFEDFQKQIRENCSQYKQIAQKWDLSDEHPGIAVNPSLDSIIRNYRPLGTVFPLFPKILSWPRFWDKPMNEGCFEKGLALAKYSMPITLIAYSSALRGYDPPAINVGHFTPVEFILQSIRGWLFTSRMILPAFYSFTFGLTSCTSATLRDEDDSWNWVAASAICGLAHATIRNNIPQGFALAALGSFLGVFFQAIRISHNGFGMVHNRMTQGFLPFTGPLDWKHIPTDAIDVTLFSEMGKGVEMDNETLLVEDRPTRSFDVGLTISCGDKPIGHRAEMRDYFFKSYVLMLTVVVWTGYTLLVAYTRQKSPKELYSSSTVVFFAECLKLLITLFFIFRDCDFSTEKCKKLLDREYFSKPMELLKMSVPSIAYAIQNNLDFVSLSNLDASVYQVMTQLKIPSTAIFMMLFLGRRFSTKRWIAIFLLCAGVASVQLDNLESERQNDAGGNQMLGILAVFATCLTAGFAGVYFEKMLKDGTGTPFWIRNLQMYSCGIFSAFIGCFVKDYIHIKRNGLFHGYNFFVLAIILFLSLGGIYISLIMKHLDNLYKSFASSISIVAVTLLSLLIFDNTSVGIFFLFGASTVCLSLVLYNSAD